LRIHSLALRGVLLSVLAAAVLLSREDGASGKTGPGYDETRREGWHVRVCEGTESSGLRFFVQEPGSRVRPRPFARWTDGGPRTLVFPPAWRWDSTRQIKFRVANDDDGREVRLCLSYGSTDQKWMMFDGPMADWTGSGRDIDDRCPISGCGSPPQSD
jgi:hypothetical protein